MSKRSSKKGLRRGSTAFASALLCFFATTALAPELPCSFVYAQSAGRVRSIACDFVPEGGCPVEPTSIRCELDVDPFDAPMDARVYVEYRNNSDRPVSAVKFRLRFVDAQGVDKGTFHAVDMVMVSPGGSHGLKAKRDFTLHPAVVGVKARVLQVKYGDGSDWTSAKMAELAQPGTPTGGGAYQAPASGAPAYQAPAYQTPAYQPAAPTSAFQPAAQTPAFQPAQQTPPQAPVNSSPPPWASNPREYENPSAAVPSNSSSSSSSSFSSSPAASTASPGLSAGADVVDSFASPPPAEAAASPAPSATAPPGDAASPAAGAPANVAPPAASNAPAAPASNPAPYQKYQGVQPTNVPFNPEADP